MSPFILIGGGDNPFVDSDEWLKFLNMLEAGAKSAFSLD